MENTDILTNLDEKTGTRDQGAFARPRNSCRRSGPALWRVTHHLDAALLAELGVDVDSHGKMPDVVLHFVEKNWLLLVESVTSHGPVDGKRHAELAKLFAGSKAGLVYVTAFPNRSIMGRYLPEIAWETEVWVADAPSHLIHFNGVRFLGPYATKV